MTLPREQPLWLKIPLNICGPLGLGLALLGFVNAALGLVFLLWTVLYIGWELYPSASGFVIRRRVLSLVVFLCIGLATGLCAWFLLLRANFPHKTTASAPPTTNTPPVAQEKPPTLQDLFLGDFPSTLRSSDNEDAISIQFPDGAVTKIKSRVYMDFDAKSKFVGFYVRASLPSSADISGDKTMKACMELVEHGAIQETFDHFEKNIAVLGGQGDQMTNMKDLTFSGRVFLYHDDFLSITQRAEIIKAYEQKHLDVNFRGPDYLGDQVIAWHNKHDKTSN